MSDVILSQNEFLAEFKAFVKNHYDGCLSRFAEAIGVSATFVSNIARGQQPPSPRILAELGYAKVVGYRPLGHGETIEIHTPHGSGRKYLAPGSRAVYNWVGVAYDSEPIGAYGNIVRIVIGASQQQCEAELGLYCPGMEYSFHEVPTTPIFESPG